MRRQQSAPVQQITYYGGLQPQGAINEAGFKGHEAEKTWDDGGVARDLIQQDMAELQKQISEVVTAFADNLAKEQAAYGAYQVRDAVAEYVMGSYLDVAVIDGHACLVLDASNDTAQFRVWWRLSDVIDTAQRAAQTAGDRHALAAIDAALTKSVGVTAPMPGERIKAEVGIREISTRANAAGIAPGRQMSRRG